MHHIKLNLKDCFCKLTQTSLFSQPNSYSKLSEKNPRIKQNLASRFDAKCESNDRYRLWIKSGIQSYKIAPFLWWRFLTHYSQWRGDKGVSYNWTIICFSNGVLLLFVFNARRGSEKWDDCIFVISFTPSFERDKVHIRTR